MKFTTLAAVAILTLGTFTAAYAEEPKATIADLDARLAKIGAAKVDGTDKAGDKTVPALYFGERKINNNYVLFNQSTNPTLPTNGGGIVIGSELEPSKVATARANLSAAGLTDLVDVREGDALDTGHKK